MSDARTTQFMPWVTNSGWTYWPLSRIAVLGSFVIALVISLPLGFWWLGMISLLVGVGLVSPAPTNRQYVYQFIGEIYYNWREKRREKRRGPYRSRELKEVLFETDDQRTKRKAVEPVQPQFVPLQGGARGYLTEVSTPGNGRHTLFTLADSHGEAVASNPEQLVVAADQFSGVLKGAAREYGVGLYASLFFMRVPTDVEDALSYFERQRFDSDDNAVQALQASYSQALAQQIDSTGGFFSGIGISVPRPRSWNKAKSLDQLTDEEIRKAIGYRVSDLLASRLDAIGVSGVRRPTPYEATMLLRAGLDVAEIERMYIDWFVDRRNEREGKLKDFSDSLVMQSGPIPDDWSVAHNYLRVGSTYHRMFFVPGYADRHVPAGLMQHLYNAPQDIWYGISEVYETISASGEQRRMKYRRLKQDADRAGRAQRGASARVEQREEESLTDEAESLLFYSRGEAIKKNLLASVSATSLQGLAESEVALRNMFRDVNLAIQPVNGRSLQIPVKLAMLGIRSDKV